MTGIVIAWFALLAVLLLIDPAWTSLLLREFKARIEVHFMYGSTSGKALWLPTFVAVACLAANYAGWLLPEAWRDTRRRVAGTLLISGLSLLIWFFAFYQVGLALRENGADPYKDGFLFSMCEDRQWLHEFISFEHPHSLKELVHRVLVPQQQLITGEGFTHFHNFSIGLPLLMIAAALLIFLITLASFRGSSLVDTLAFTTGFYLLFFSYFDGGILVGGQGIVFLLFPSLPRGSGPLWRRRECSSLLLFGAAIGLQILCQRLFHVLGGMAFDPEVGPAWVAFFMKGETISHFVILLIFNGVALWSSQKFLAAVFLSLALAGYAGSWSRWTHVLPYLQTVPAGHQELVFLYTGAPAGAGEPLIIGKNFQMILYTAPAEGTKWEICSDLLRRAEGISYKSIMVGIYCSMTELPARKGPTARSLRYTALAAGDCGYTCSPKLSELFQISPGPGRTRIVDGFEDARDKAVVFCLDRVTKIAMKPGGSP